MDWWEGRRLARRDLQKLKQLRGYMRDKRRRPSMSDRMAWAYQLKQHQFNMTLHRQRLTSPFDYEYPRFKQMNKLARGLFERHLQAWESLWKIEELLDMLVYEARSSR